MNLEPIIQSEVSQKEKDKYHTLMHIYGIQKDDTDEFICRVAMEKQTQRTDLWTWWGGQEEEGEMYGNNNMETYNTICKIDSQWEFALYLRELIQGFYINLRVAMGGRLKREGTYVYLWLSLVDVRQKPTKFSKAIILQLKI